MATEEKFKGTVSVILSAQFTTLPLNAFLVKFKYDINVFDPFNCLISIAVSKGMLLAFLVYMKQERNSQKKTLFKSFLF